MAKTITIRRLMKEYQDLMKNPEPSFFIQPVSENELFEWHFTIRGCEETDFEGALIHGRLLLPCEYPLKPPDVVFLTPNGRFEIHKKICLSFSSYHQETWQAGWNIRNMMIALIAFMDVNELGIGSIRLPKKQRKILSRESVEWTCKACKKSNYEIMKNHCPEFKTGKCKSTKEIKDNCTKLEEEKPIEEKQVEEKFNEEDVSDSISVHEEENSVITINHTAVEEIKEENSSEKSLTSSRRVAKSSPLLLQMWNVLFFSILLALVYKLYILVNE